MEFPAAESERIALEIRRTGSAVVRGAWRPEALMPFRAAIENYVQARHARARTPDARPLDRMLDTHGAGTAQMMANDGHWTADDFKTLFAGSAYARICEDFFGGGELRMSMDRNGFRIHDPAVSDKSFIPYHQDSYTQDRRVKSVLNCWTPLDPAGVDAPGLEVVRDPCRANFPRKAWGLASANAAYDGITIERERIVAEYGEAFAAPALAVGDCLIFSEHVIHRTYVTPGMTKPRINLEFRVFSGGVCVSVPGLPPIEADTLSLTAESRP
ncbi:MAG: phytanoyl-CoA dioxygenase family protein [Tagaea sp.]|nr:phytanoyl-CoA dioxygenase family protein [Tagaea sp.]